MVNGTGGQNMTGYTVIQCHFVRGQLNHRIRFGTPERTIKLDKYRMLACYLEGSTFGYIRWRANEYGTQDWRFYILKTQTFGVLTRVPGVSPAVKILASFIGTQAVKRALFAFDEVEKEAAHGVDTLSDAYWAGFQNHLNLRQSPVNFLRNVSIVGASHAR